MATSSMSFRIAQATGLVGAAWLSGNIAALSLISLPALTTSQTRDSVPSSTLTRQWKYLFSLGKAQNPPVAVLSAASLSYLAWTVITAAPMQARLYGVAAVLTVGIVPWTIFAMMPTNEKLLGKAEEVGVKGDEEVVGALLRRWTVLNGVRSLFPLVGSVVAAVAILS